MLPTFIIAGAGRSATTSLWEYVTAHPDVCGGTLKEPAFFTNAIGCGDKQDGRSPRLSGTFTKGIAWYESLFDGCREAKAVGEASTLYMTEEDSPALIKEHIPQVKLIFILRNPIDRIRSHYWYERRNGWPLPALDELVSQRHPALKRYIYVSKYHIHIERYMRVFPRDQVMVLLTEEMRRDPASAIKKAYEFIGVDSSYLPENLGDRINASRLPKSRVAHRVLDFLIAQRGRLESSPRLNMLMTKVGRLFIKLNSSSIPSSDSWGKHRLTLLAELDETIEYMEDFLGRPLEEWRK